MMPPALAQSTGLPVAPAPPASPDIGRHPSDDRHAASGGADFTGLLALLAGALSPAPPPPVAGRGDAPARAAAAQALDSGSPHGAPIAPAVAPESAMPDSVSGTGTPAPAGQGGTEGHGSAVAALAHQDRGDGPGSPVAALAHSEPAEDGRSAVAALAHQDRGDRIGSTDAAPAPASDATVTAGASDPVAALRSVEESGGSESSGPSGPSASARRSPNLGPITPTTTPPAVGSAPVRPAEAVAAPAHAAPAATPAAVADQIVSAVVSLHGRGDGRHVVTLELRPEELGSIRVEMSVEHQTVHLTLHAAEPATGRLLAAALPDLRSALADAGLTAGHLGVGADSGHGAGRRHSDGAGDADRPGASLRPPDGLKPAGERTVAVARPAAAAGRLDLFL